MCLTTDRLISWLKASIRHGKYFYLLVSSQFNSRQKFGNSRAAILVIVENINQNQLDQRHVEYEIERLEYGIKIIRLTLTEAYDR